MKIVLAEDQPLILESLKLLLEENGEIEVAAGVADGRSALEAVRRIGPDVAVLDIRMPGLSGVEVARAMKADGLGTPVLLLTTFDEADAIREAVEIGVEGFLLKDVAPELFVSAVKAIAGGLLVFHPAIRPHLAAKSVPSPSGAARYGLTGKDLAMIEAIIQGLSNKEIADREGCSEGTVKNRVSSILGKMGLNARTQIAVTALKENLV